MDDMKALDAIKQKINAGSHVGRMGKRDQRGGAVRRFARRLGFELLDDYWALLAFADGFILENRVWFGFAESVDLLVLFQEEWMDQGRFWPLSDDGCGNYYCVAENGSVVFFDTMESRLTPVSTEAPTVDAFILHLIQK